LGTRVDRDRAITHLEHVRYVVTADAKEIAKQTFKAGQQPAAWLRSAGRLRDAAEVILKQELPAEVSYSQALEIADEEAVAEIARNNSEFGAADIKAIAPNYPRLNYCMPTPSRTCSRASWSSSGRTSSKNTSCTAS
jgi:hypothetical protein